MRPLSIENFLRLDTEQLEAGLNQLIHEFNLAAESKDFKKAHTVLTNLLDTVADYWIREEFQKIAKMKLREKQLELYITQLDSDKTQEWHDDCLRDLPRMQVVSGSDVLYLRARMHFYKNNLKDAMKDAIAYANDRSTELDKIYRLCDSFTEINDLEGAIEFLSGYLSSLSVKILNINVHFNNINTLQINSISILRKRAELFYRNQQPDAAIKDLDELLKRDAKNIEVLEMKARLYKEEGNEYEAILSEHKIHELSLATGKAPSLLSFAKMSFFKYEATIYASGKIYNMDHEQRTKLRATLALTGINAVTMASMRTKLNSGNCLMHAKTVFDQLDRLDELAGMEIRIVNEFENLTNNQKPH